MKTRDLEELVLDQLWPLRPFDVARVCASAILVAVFASDSDHTGFLWLWVGTALGLLMVLVHVWRRARRATTSSNRSP